MALFVLKAVQSPPSQQFFLNGGALTNFDVIGFLTEVLKDVPDIHAAAVISEAVTKLIPVLSCDLASLMVEAQSAESHTNSIIKNHNQGRLPYVCH